ncbi:MAG: aminotransferase class V-fold PLP-dependent enzyme [Hyphomicrobiaceae bacterium]
MSEGVSVPAARLAELRQQEFPGACKAPYLNTAARSLLPRSSQAAMVETLDLLAAGDVDKDAWFALMERVRGKVARLIHADADEIAFTKNISEGLNIIATAFDWKPGESVVICPDIEHPNNIFPWYNLEARAGIKVKEVQSKDGRVSAESILGAIDASTRMVALATVSFSPGYHSPVAEIGRACRERGVFFLVDGAQSVGHIHTDVEALSIDGLAASTQKSLMGVYGMGFLYCRRAWAERLRPAYLARFGVDLGGGAHEATRGSADVKLMPGARRFEVGNYNFPAAAALDRSLDILLEIGTEAIEAHVDALAHRLASGLLQLGLPVMGGRPGPHLGGIVSVGHLGAGGHDTAEDPAMASLHEALTAAGIRLSVRQGMLRFSMHLFNDTDDIEKVLHVARAWRDANPSMVAA